VFEVGVNSKRVHAEYEHLIKNVGNEFYILIDAPIEKIKDATGDENIALAIGNMRAGKIGVFPGYDGIFGRIDLLQNNKKKRAEQGRLLFE